MGEAKYKIILKGVAQGQDPELVKKNLASLFKVAPVQVERYLAQAPHDVKRHVEAGSVEKYRAAMEKAGAVCAVEPEEELPQEQDLKLEMEAAEETAPEVPKTICPKCGAEQERSEKCVKCGLVFADYYKQEQPEEQQAPAPDKKDAFPKITPIYIPAKKTKPIVWVIRVAVVALILFGAWWAKENIRERDEKPLPNPSAEISDLMPAPRKLDRLFKNAERSLVGKYPRRYYIVDDEGQRSDIMDKYSVFYRYGAIAKTVQGARTLVIVRVKEEGKEPLESTLDVMFVDISDPSRMDICTIASVPPSQKPPNGILQVYTDALNTPREFDGASDHAGMVKKLLTLAMTN